MHLRRDNEQQWEKLDKSLDNKRTMKKSMVIKDAASSAVNPKNDRKPKGLSKALAVLSIQNPTLYKMLLKRLKKAENFKKPKEENETEEKPTDEEPKEESVEQNAGDSDDNQEPEEEAAAQESEIPEEEQETQEMAQDDSQVESAPEEKLPEHQVAQPDPTMAQPNTEESEQRMSDLEMEIQSLESALAEIQALTHEQGLLSEQELAEIIIPLKEELSRLSSLVRPEDDDYRQTNEPQNGPRRYAASVERSLEYPSSSWVERNSKQGDIKKARGWHGDPEGHAEAARDRWEQEGVSPGGDKTPSKPEQPKKPSIAGGLGKELQRAARKTGRAITDATVDVVSDVGLQAAGTIAGILIYRYLQAKPIHPKAIAGLALSSTKRGIRQLLNTRRLKQLRTAENLARLRRKASIANVIGRTARRGAAHVVGRRPKI